MIGKAIIPVRPTVKISDLINFFTVDLQTHIHVCLHDLFLFDFTLQACNKIQNISLTLHRFHGYYGQHKKWD